MPSAGSACAGSQSTYRRRQVGIRIDGLAGAPCTLPYSTLSLLSLRCCVIGPPVKVTERPSLALVDGFPAGVEIAPTRSIASCPVAKGATVAAAGSGSKPTGSTS